MLGTLVQGRVCVGGAGINAAKVALTIATKYAVRRRQFEATSPDEEQLLLDYGMHQRRLLPLLARTYALHFAQEVVAGQLHDVFSGPGPTDEDSDEHARRSWSRARPAPRRSAPGTPPAPSRSAARPAAVPATSARTGSPRSRPTPTSSPRFEGDNHVLLQLVAKGLLTDYASEFEDMDQLGMVRFVAGLAVETVVERTAVHKLLQRIADLLPGGDTVGPGGRAARPRLPAGDAALPRGAHDRRRRPPPQARHRPGDEPRCGLLPGAGPRHRRGPRPHRAAGARGLRRQDGARCPTATSRSRSTCCATCTR